MSIKEKLEKVEVQVDLAKMELKDIVEDIKDEHAREKGLRDEQAAIDLVMEDVEADLNKKE